MLLLNAMKSFLFPALCVSILSSGCGAAPEPSALESSQEQAVQAVSTPGTTCPATTLACGSTCPVDYHVSGRVCACASGGYACGIGQTGDGVKCVKNTEAFFLCGSTCPSGFVARSTQLSHACDSTVGSIQGEPQTLCATH